MNEKKPPARDPNNVAEIFVNEVISIELDPSGACVITWGIRRLIDNGEKAPTVDLQVVQRTAMSAATLQGFVNQVIGMDRALKQHRQAQAGASSQPAVAH